ncbi:MAG: DUF4159 domain-containing protein [Planctomycetota bacterium]|jgi:hypothetical protein
MRRTLMTLSAVFLVICPSAAAAGKGKEFSDANVEAAIKLGEKFLWSQQRKDGNWPAMGGYPVGPSAMAAYALLESGVSVQDERMAKALEWLKNQKCVKTYSLGLRAQAWLAAIKKGGQFHDQLTADVKTLVNSTANGSYGYNSLGQGKSSGDNSNSQYGLLGVWAGAMLEEIEIPRSYWQVVMAHWVNTQHNDGGWSYKGGGASTTAMTAAGVASLFVCFDNLFRKSFMRCDLGDTGRLAQRSMQHGLDWFDNNFPASMVGKAPMGHSDLLYYLYGVERVGLASGYKYFGKSDWYKIAATKLINIQRPDGSWPGKWQPVPNTAFGMLFLVRGRRPVILNKLEFNGDWNNRPRDLAYLTRWLSGIFEADVYWQIINLDVPPREWHDAPVLYISGARAPKFSEEDLDKIRRYVWQGGTIFSLTECQGQLFTTTMGKYYERLFPNYKLVKCAADHKIYNVQYRLRPETCSFYIITNGVRPLVVHSDTDLARSWQLQRTETKRDAFEAAANIYMYVTDRSLTPRGTKLWPEQPDSEPQSVVKLARLKFDGNWNPEPLAYERFSRLMARDYKVKIDVAAVTIDKLAESGAKIATLTGTGKLEPDEAQRGSLRDFIAGGGTLVVDAAGGDRQFANAASKMLGEMFQGSRLRRLESSEPLLSIDGLEIEKVKYRRKARLRLRTNRANLRILRIENRPAVIYSREDITAGLVGYTSYTCDGYDPESAFQIMRNIVVHFGNVELASQSEPPAESEAKE